MMETNQAFTISGSGNQSEVESGPDSSYVGPISPSSSAIVHVPFMSSPLYQYITELDRLKQRILEQPQSSWLVTLTVKEARNFSLNWDGCDEKALEICRHILSALPGATQGLRSVVYDSERDSDNDFIVFEEESEKDEHYEGLSECDTTLAHRLWVPVLLVFSVTRALNRLSSSRGVTHSYDFKADLLVEVADPTHYPTRTPLLSLELKNVPRRHSTAIHTVIESTAVQWSLGRILEPSIELVLHQLIKALDELEVPTFTRQPSRYTRNRKPRSRLGSADDSRRGCGIEPLSTGTQTSAISDGENEASDLQYPLWPAHTQHHSPPPCSSDTPPSPRARTLTTDDSNFPSIRCSKSIAERASMVVMRSVKPDLSLTGTSYDNLGTSLGASATLWRDSSKDDRRESSRYFRDFEEVEVLGVGAFGAVTKCRWKIGEDKDSSEATFFAIKRIPLMADSEKQNLALQREAANLAVLHHPHIVRYYSAWIENIPQQSQPQRSSTPESTLHSHSFHAKREKTRTRNTQFRTPMSTTVGVHQSSGVKPLHSRLGHRVNEFSTTSERSSGWNSTSKQIFSSQPNRYLFIQMEYCSGQSLRKAIDSGLLHGKEELIWIAFRQILDGLAYMHSHGLIHRDLKPCNIFLHGELSSKAETMLDKRKMTEEEHKQTSSSNSPKLHIKIGDFGLTTFVGGGFGPRTPSRNEFTRRSAAVKSGSINLSAGVGTKFYMAPEQETGGAYNDKADMFSLGVVFFELWHPPFKTSMERAIVLTNLSRGCEFPPGFEESLPPEVPDILRRLLSPSPADRPAAQSLLHSLLLPYVAPGEFQPVYDSISRHAFSAEASHIVAALFNRQLQHQLYESTHLEHRLLPDPEKSSWKRNLALTDVVLRLDATFRSRGAIRVECPILFPRTANCCPSTSSFHPVIVGGEMISTSNETHEHSAALEALSHAPSETAILHPDELHRHRVFLDRHGAPVFFPNRLVSGFARTAPAFLSSGPSICRRFSIQDVQYSLDVGHLPSTRLGGISDTLHAFYDVGVKLGRVLESDARSAILKAAATATRSVRSRISRKVAGISQTKLLLYLMRLPATPSSPKPLRRCVTSAFRRLYGFNSIALLEAETIGVTCQALMGTMPLKAKLGAHKGFQIVWTHGMIFPAILHELLGVPLSSVQSFQREIAWMISTGISKEELYGRFAQIPIPSLDEHVKFAGIRHRAELLYDLLFFKGDVQAWIKKVQHLIHLIEGTISIVELILRHIEFLDQLISSLPFGVSICFAPIMSYDDSTFGKGLIFVVTPGSPVKPQEATKSNFKTNEAKTSSKTGEQKSVLEQKSHRRHAHHQQPSVTALSESMGSAVTQAHTSMTVDMDQASSYPSVKNATTPPSCPVSLGTFSCTLAVGGCYDFLVSEMCTHPTWPASSALFGVEIVVDLLIDSHFRLLTCTYGQTATYGSSLFTLHPTGGRTVDRPILPSAAGGELRRLVDHRIPQVFIIVVRSEQQVYAISLRRRLLQQGIQCERRVDRIVDASQFRRRAKNTSSVMWVVQMRDCPDGITYKLQYFGREEFRPTENDLVFDEEDKVVEYLLDYFGTNWNVDNG